jgi:hypothetical protein
MNERIDRIEREMAALEELQLSLTANSSRTPFQEAQLSLLPAKLARLESRYNNLVTALAPTQGNLLKS